MSFSGRARCATRLPCRETILKPSFSRSRSRFLEKFSSFLLGRSNHSPYPHRVRFVVRISWASLEIVLSRHAEAGSMINDALLQSLHLHLAGWGLRQFTSDEAYFQWQRETLSPADIAALHRQGEQKRGGFSAHGGSLFEGTAHSNHPPGLSCQRVDHYLAIRFAAGERPPEV